MPEKGLGYDRALTPARRPYKTKDGHIALLPITDRHWSRLFELVGRPELAADQRFAKPKERFQNVPALYEILAPIFLQRTSAEWCQLLDAADIPNGPISSLEDLLQDPYLAEIGFFVHRQHHSEGATIAMDIPTTYSRSPGSLRTGAPRLGEHTHEVLRSIGYTEQQIEEIVASGGVHGVPQTTS
jgi:crotonobetainyl-CoA:carnitine CoA-transferase CaiB-like acyl-CoA transferase